MKAEIHSINYIINLTVGEMVKILRKDNRVKLGNELDFLLEDEGAEDIDCSGAFGPFVYFSCKQDEVDKYVKIVKDYLNES